ncbi:MAG: GNAT family protein [Pseudomonadota bacterium]
MRLLKFSGTPSTEPQVLKTKRLLLRRPETDDFSQWASLRGRSAGFLRPFEPAWAQDELSKRAFKARLRRHESDITSGRGIPWFLFLPAADGDQCDTLVGGITISHIRRGVSHSGTVGYWMGEPYAGQGFMSEAVREVCKCAFELHNLNRLEAATVLENERSQRLLRHCGFKEEGIARAYLKIADTWRDHRLFARLASDPIPDPLANARSTSCSDAVRPEIA